MRYKTRMDGEGWEEKPGRIFRLACCDCGLVHDMVVVVEGDELGIAARRNERATSAKRRAFKSSLTKGTPAG